MTTINRRNDKPMFTENMREKLKQIQSMFDRESNLTTRDGKPLVKVCSLHHDTRLVNYHYETQDGTRISATFQEVNPLMS